MVPLRIYSENIVKTEPTEFADGSDVGFTLRSERYDLNLRVQIALEKHLPRFRGGKEQIV